VPETVLNQPKPDDVFMERQIVKLLDKLLGAQPASADKEPRVVVAARVRTETRRRLEAMAKMHPGYEEKVGILIANLLDGFAQGLLPCPFCKHPYPPKIKALKR
jgi:hypothetical protein